MLARDELTDPERKVWEAFESGATIDLRTGNSESDDPATGETWDTKRQIRAQLLFDLVTKAGGPAGPRSRILRLAGARVTGTLDLEAATLAWPVLLRDCFFDEPITLTEASASALRLPGCHVPGLIAGQLRTQGNLELNEGFGAEGEITLRGAHVGGRLNLEDATLMNPNGVALNGDGLTIDQAMLCGGLRAEGEMRLLGAKIGHQLTFVDATLTNPIGVALRGDGLTVDQAMLCFGGFRAEGEIILRGARVGGQLSFEDAILTNPNGVALVAESLIVDQDMLCSEGFRAEGEITLRGARVGGQLSFEDAILTNPDGVALNLQELHAKVLLLLPETSPEGAVDLTNAQVGVFLDNEDTWPTIFAQRGFVYDALDERSQISVEARLRWLDRDPAGYAPQPYEQLVAVYRRAGRDDDARKVAIAKQRRRRKTLNWPGKVWSSLLRWTVGYGYRTWQAGLWLLGLLAVGAAIFASAHPGDMALAKKPGDPLPAFQPWVYSLDALLPVVNLHQEEFWIPEGAARWWAWFSILAGWLLTTVVIASLTGLLKKD